jgi:hypothetical protein
VNDQHSHISVSLVQVGEGSVECNRYCIICGSVVWYANWSGSRVSRVMAHSLSNNFIATDVSAMGR